MTNPNKSVLMHVWPVRRMCENPDARAKNPRLRNYCASPGMRAGEQPKGKSI